ncbi:MAG: methyltransferase domain-containing protein [Myxococcota bacterium]|nr:methyltransferase domain-containing protein [Myxococcota bacterium]MDP6243777.1 methyltransferase domain-containing protein [Myxococcota bacterium]MDP7073035.1 methyltransferase domain-containing protein [Myxococcota bacterium]MDP7298495.1 methyltransferase domain-containing protein [Myxococcota bacterium]MDP7431306.1 methyltransferase domain-containing protein [Myxococcota bacterium]
MRVVDLDRDMRDVIPTGTSRDSEFLFGRMTEVTLGRTRPGPGRRILDVAAGLGQDAAQLASDGASCIGLEPSQRMSQLARLANAPGHGLGPTFVRGWGDALPFASDSFDAVLCKGSLDHFDRPRAALAEMARVARPEGRVVVAIANFESVACRVSRTWDGFREGWLGRELPRGRRHYDVPHDHFTRYQLGLMREQLGEVVEVDCVEGISLAWGLPGWSRVVERLPGFAADAALQVLDAVAGRLPGFADVLVLAGPPRRSATASE